MIIAIPRELTPDERRVAASPDSVRKLKELGFEVCIEQGAGAASSFTDALYEQAGAEIIQERSALFEQANVLLKVNGPLPEEVELLKEGTMLISFLWPAQHPDLLKKLAEKKINVLAMDSVPRISRAQKMDALSTMANIGGYRAVVEAANVFGRFLTGQITAAGKIPPAKVLVIGAGVAGLAAIGTAKSMGAIVRAFDTRAEVKQQVESMGGEFLTVDIQEDGAGSGGYAKEMSKEFIEAEMALFREQAREVDIVITTALIPGKPAPKLWQADAVQAMKEGSVVVDMAAEQGGNCELTEPGEVVTKDGVTIIGYTNLASRLPGQASSLYSQNLVHLLAEMTPEKDGQPVIDMENEAIRGATVVKDGEITWPPPPPKLTAAPPPKPEPEKPKAEPVTKEEKGSNGRAVVAYWVVAGALLYWLGQSSPPAFLNHFMVFVLSIFIGWQVIWNVSHSLHTPLMSVTNAISGIIVVGALLQVSSGSFIVSVLAFISILLASINIVGGFLVTKRMLAMFRR
ncbi:Re/Si-specific NAD(P)(+) transhydrogenase subunit alpha [Parendozoicomonas haliclonae]|uniref:NAD(P) transhydrogenase subunit alpha n=1 Tax=Parendozoicomonas haliclonae TaxID=1960125 RepID=A0A1X7AJ35_9GAMM|nr:Re/Si-specific NAD(P)(+) transhydrogenase subunit alpha [Parendozoicomonas haliclonae]SMA45179.1 NAD(P) transhydrogenase subunit alpha [Parendozoicomonas haliclonae]